MDSTTSRGSLLQSLTVLRVRKEALPSIKDTTGLAQQNDINVPSKQGGVCLEGDCYQMSWRNCPQFKLELVFSSAHHKAEDLESRKCGGAKRNLKGFKGKFSKRDWI